MSPVVSLSPEQFASLQRLACKTHRDHTWHVHQALTLYLQAQLPSDPVEQGLADARAGHLLDLSDIEAKWRQTPCSN